MRYDFSRLSPGQFEEMAVSLYAKILGFETKIYGAGPDGQREFTFDRPFTDAQGNEYTGMTFGQVKYRDPSTKGNEFDWLKNQFEGEMSRFAEKDASYRPQNYFFITNLVLTPVKDTGIKDKLDKLAESYKWMIPNIFFAGYDELCKLIDNNESVRNAYTGLIMPGDVLAELLNTIRKDFSEEINVYLRSAFSEDIYTRIEQAGSIPENMKTLIADVGIDLGVKELQGTEGKALEMFIGAGNGRCGARQGGRFILIGGPGKGKSTITQFLAQIYRASYLEYAGAADEETTEFLAKIRERFDFKVENCRIPFVIEIKKYAHWIARRAKDESRSLLAYITEAFNRICDSGLTPKEVGELFKKMPWLLVFDGLDEVPESSNRNAVLAEIGKFMDTRLKMTGSDCMIIATSREQGYGGEFEVKEFRRLELQDLTPEDCIKYLEYFFKAAEQRQDNRERYLAAIQKALGDSEKAALLTTPLQATIMAIIVKSGGSLPNNRYDLFRQYCDVVIKRESQKEILPVLNEDTSYEWIYELHQRIALHLMEASDSPENPAAELTLEQLKNEIRTYLKEYLDPYVETNPKNPEDVCLRAVTERVCFLTEGQEGVFSFAIRSMQEFFAGIALVDGKGNDDEIKEALLKIARRSYWRNTLLFAVGHLVRHTKNRKAGAIMKDICEEINGIDNFPEENFTADNYCRFGSHLAVALLAENLFIRRDQDGLVRIAAELFDNDNYYAVYSRLAGAAAVRLVERIETEHGREASQHLKIVKYVLPMQVNPRNDFGEVLEGYFERASENKFEMAVECMTWAEYLKERNGALLDKCFKYYTEEIERGTAPEGPFTYWGYLKYVCSRKRAAVSEKVRAYIERELYYWVRSFVEDFDFDEQDPLFGREFVGLVRKIFTNRSIGDDITAEYRNLTCGLWFGLPRISAEDIEVSKDSSVPVFMLLMQLLREKSREAFDAFEDVFKTEAAPIKRLYGHQFRGSGIVEGDFQKYRALEAAKEAVSAHGFEMRAAAILDGAGQFYLEVSENEKPDREGILDDLEVIIRDEEVSEESLMTGIYFLLAIFDSSDGRCIELAHHFLDAVQKKGVSYNRTLILLWNLYEAGDKDYVRTYRFGSYSSNKYWFPRLHYGDKKTTYRAVRILEETVYEGLPVEFLALVSDWLDMSFGESISVDQAVLNRLEKRCEDGAEERKLIKRLQYLSGGIFMEEMLTCFDADNEDDQWSMYRLVKDYLKRKRPEERKQDLMALVRWCKNSEDLFWYNDFIRELEAAF